MQYPTPNVCLVPRKRGSLKDFPGGPVVKTLPSNAEDAGSIPGWRTNSTCCGAAEQVRHNWTEACVQRQGSFMPQPRLNEAKQIISIFSKRVSLSRGEELTPWDLPGKMSEVAQSCLTLCNPMDGSPPGSSVHGIFQARVLQWVAISFSRGSSHPRD